MGNNSKVIFDYFLNKGLDPIHAAALAGNAMGESGGRPGAINRVNARDPGAVGIFQMRGPRRHALERMAQDRKMAPDDLTLQLDHAWEDLTGPERRRAFEPLLATKTPEDAAVSIRRNYLRPGENEARDEVRIAATRNILRGNLGQDTGAEPQPRQSKSFLDFIIKPVAADEFDSAHNDLVSEARKRRNEIGGGSPDDLIEESARRIASGRADQEDYADFFIDHPDLAKAARVAFHGNPIYGAASIADLAGAGLRKIGVGDHQGYELKSKLNQILQNAGIDPGSEGVGEDVLTAAFGALNGAGAARVVGGALSKVAPSATRLGRAANVMGENPFSQMAGAGGATAASDLVREHDQNLPEWGRTAAEIGAGVLGGGVAGAVGGRTAQVASRMAQAAKRSAGILTGSPEYLDDAAGRLLYRSASNPEDAIRNLEASIQTGPRFVGAPPTTAEAARDVDLGYTASSLPGTKLATAARVQNLVPIREAQRDAAIQAELNRANHFRPDAEIDILDRIKSQKTRLNQKLDDDMYFEALDPNDLPVDTNATRKLIDELKREGYGKTKETNFLDNFIKQLDEAPPEGITNGSFRHIWNLRQAVDELRYDQLLNAYSGSKRGVRNAAQEIRTSLNDALKKSYPKFEQYLKGYAGLSRLEERLKLGRELADKTKSVEYHPVLVGAMEEGGQRLIPGKFSKMNIAEVEAKNGAKLSKRQRDAFERATQEMRDGALLRPNAAYAGSRTAPTFAAGDVLSDEIVGALMGEKRDSDEIVGALVEDKSGGALSRAVSELLHKSVGIGGRLLSGAEGRTERELMRRVARGLMDPNEGLRLMQRGRPATSVQMGALVPSGLEGMLSNFLYTR